MMTKPIASRDDLLSFGAVEVISEDVTVGKDTRKVYFRELTGAGMQLFINLQGAQATFSTDEMIEILAVTLCDESGALLFKSDHEALREMKWEVLNALFLTAMRVIKLTKDSVENEKKG